MIGWMREDWQGAGPIHVAYSPRIFLGRLGKTMKKLSMCLVSWPILKLGFFQIQFLQCDTYTYINLLVAVHTKFVYGGQIYCFLRAWKFVANILSISSCRNLSRCVTLINVFSVLYVIIWRRRSLRFGDQEILTICTTSLIYISLSVRNITTAFVRLFISKSVTYVFFCNKRRKHVRLGTSTWEPITGGWRNLRWWGKLQRVLFNKYY
jgi:hypothetical protein